MSRLAKRVTALTLTTLAGVIASVMAYVFSASPKTTEMVPNTVTHVPPIFDALTVAEVFIGIAAVIALFVWMED